MEPTGMSARQVSALSVDPGTGMVEALGGFPNVFDAERKAHFLELYKAEGIRLRRACRSMGLSEATVNHHLKIDPVFKEQFDAVEKDYLEELEATSRSNALNPKAVIERIFQLKCLLPGKYGQENGYSQRDSKIVINIQGDMLIDAKRRAEIVDTFISKEAESARLDMGSAPA